MQDATKKPYIPRVITYNDETLQQIKLAAEAQMTMKQIAASFGISDVTFVAFRKAYPEIDELIRMHRARPIRDVANKLIQKAESGDVNAQKFLLERKGDWTQKQSVALTGGDGGPIQSSNVNFNSDMTYSEAQKLFMSKLATPLYKPIDEDEA